MTAAAVKAEGQVKRKLGAHMKGQFMPAIYVKVKDFFLFFLSFFLSHAIRLSGVH